jgi:hypothetical protein
MPELGVIYGLKHENEIRYVGKTGLDPQERLRGHITDARRGADLYRARWIRSVNYDVELLVLERDPPGGLNEAEKAWIATLRRYGCRLTNLTEGGDGHSAGSKIAREAGRKGGRAIKGKLKSPQHRASLSAAITGTTHDRMTPAVRDKIGRANTGDHCACRGNSRYCAYCRRQVS